MTINLVLDASSLAEPFAAIVIPIAIAIIFYSAFKAMGGGWEK